MAWQAVYENLEVFSSEATHSRDLPVDGLQALILDGEPCCGFDVCGFDVVRGQEAVLVPKIAVRERELRQAYPNARIVRTRNTSTIQFHRVENLVGLWAPENKKREPHAGWEKDDIGWRMWTETEVFDSKDIAPGEWFDLWSMLPADGHQFTVVYENWKTPGGDDYARVYAGNDYVYLWQGPYGLVWGKDNDLDTINGRYPGAAVKRGTLMPDEAFRVVREQVDVAGVF